MINNICSKFLKHLCDIQMKISLFSLVFMVLLNTFEIFRRFFFGLSIIWVQDITTLCLIWFTFTGFSKISYDKTDIYIEALLKKLPLTVRKFTKLFTIICCMFFSAIFFYFALRLFQSQYGQVSIVAKYPIGFRTAAAVLNGFTLVMINIGELKEWILTNSRKKEGELS